MAGGGIEAISCAAGAGVSTVMLESSPIAAGDESSSDQSASLGSIQPTEQGASQVSLLFEQHREALSTEQTLGRGNSSAYVTTLASVFAAGFAVTAVEIALGRLLAPFYGSGLLVWSTIIASVIAALSVGYPLGGYLIDRFPDSRVPLFGLAAGGILSTLLGVSIPNWLRAALAGVAFGGTEYWSSLVLALLGFCVPCCLLATVSPAAVRLRLRGTETAGRIAGFIYALGSIGSVLGILLTALYTIPQLGLRWTFVLIGALAVCPLVLSIISASRHSLWLWSLPCLVTAGALIPQTPSEPDLKGTRLLYEGDSAIQHIRVLEADLGQNRRRFLQLDEGWAFHSILSEPTLVTDSILDEMALSGLFASASDGHMDILIVGLAGGTVSNLMTRYLRGVYPGLRITGIELDKGVVEVADRFMGLDRTLTHVEISDGRAWLRYSSNFYDVIIIDAYRQPSIPAHLATLEFFQEVEGHLSAGGLAVLNLAAVPNGRVVRDLSSTWNRVFEPAQIAVDPKEVRLTSHLLFGGPAVPLHFVEESLLKVPPELRTAWHRLRERLGPIRLDAKGEVWTDDCAPVELFADRAFRASRSHNRIQH